MSKYRQHAFSKKEHSQMLAECSGGDSNAVFSGLLTVIFLGLLALSYWR